MDGNRRWAAARGLPSIAGHVQGVEAIVPIVRSAPDRDIEVLSLYVFSQENWRRPDEEVTGLFGLIDGAVRQYTDELVEQGVRVRVIGRLHEAPVDVQRSIREAEEKTRGGTRMALNIAFNYSGRNEIVDAVRALIAAGVPAHEIDERAPGRAPVHGRPAGPRPDHPHRRREAHQQLPALAGRLCRAGVLQHPVARLRGGRPGRRAGRVRASASDGTGPDRCCARAC